jgi:hypothetical protein
MTQNSSVPSDAASTSADGAPKGDPISHRIIALCEERGSVSPQDVAKDFFAEHRKAREPDDGWHRYMNPVKQQMVHLARAGVVDIIRKGEPVDPNDFRGLVRIRLSTGEAPNRDEE